ncbi:MAG: glutathione S-transferase C-terminal domain-containing protein, partial [Myxococcota bacterium]
DVEPQRVPPARNGFPPTHNLLDESWRAYLAAMETVLAEQPFILGERFTIADASAYGQLSMNLIDPSTNAELQERAPLTHEWLLGIRDGKHKVSRGKLFASVAIDPLLQIIMTTFAPLMDQNEKAWRIETQKGQTLFNERAFNRGQALYNGELNGHPFRSVVKTFQVRVWNDLRENWRVLPESERVALAKRLPGHPLFDES